MKNSLNFQRQLFPKFKSKFIREFSIFFFVFFLSQFWDLFLTGFTSGLKIQDRNNSNLLLFLHDFLEFLFFCFVMILENQKVALLDEVAKRMREGDFFNYDEMLQQSDDIIKSTLPLTNQYYLKRGEAYPYGKFEGYAKAAKEFLMHSEFICLWNSIILSTFILMIPFLSFQIGSIITQ